MGGTAEAAGSVASAAIYAGANALSWTQALLVPGLQAAANILLLERQKDMWDDLRSEDRSLFDAAVSNYFACIDSLLPAFEDAYDDVPEAAEYVPVNPCDVQGDTISCNIGHINAGDEWAQCINRLHEQSDVTRMIALDPRYLVNMDMHSQSITDLLRGKASAGDVMEIFTDSAEQACASGRTGGCRYLLGRNLGISKTRMQAEGRKEMREEVKMLEMVSPANRRADIREMMQTPQQRIALALTQAQLIQNSLQNLHNRNARKPPHRLAELQVRLDRCVNRLTTEAGKANMGSGFVPNYAAVLQPQITAVANAIGGASFTAPKAIVVSENDAPHKSGTQIQNNTNNAGSVLSDK